MIWEEWNRKIQSLQYQTMQWWNNDHKWLKRWIWWRHNSRPYLQLQQIQQYQRENITVGAAGENSLMGAKHSLQINQYTNMRPTTRKRLWGIKKGWGGRLGVIINQIKSITQLRTRFHWSAWMSDELLVPSCIILDYYP